MTAFPLNVVAEYGSTIGYFIYAVLGLFFGFILESAGFGNSRKLAAQFYFKELTVFKVMFTAIIVAMVLIFLSSSLGLLDYQLIWVNPTYLWPGILGGLIMGAGFIIGGFCPGTSLVAAATLKLDGIFFVLGVLLGIFIFGDTVDFYSEFFNGSYFGRVTLPEIFNLSYGTVVLLVVLMALAMFWGAEWLENALSDFPPPPKWRLPAAVALASLATITLILGQPDLSDRWLWIAGTEQTRIENREIYVSPMEVATLQNDRQIRVRLLDIRGQSDFNSFHIREAEHTPLDKIQSLARDLIDQPANTVNIIAGNGELRATQAWKQLRAASIPNLYVLEGGVNGWIRQFAPQSFLLDSKQPESGSDEVGFHFAKALGNRYPMASPNLLAFPEPFVDKVKLEVKRAPAGGGCG
ncbi:YeeE/YedE thiosulfate transporter family protein [Teredinibacter haidensis]|uniref:YeeE/YedE thiosulfate transporter family protein n=1 Tax=Teredinibacter haidensis TaxID=2731755 RepID=UPI000948CDCC|nr:YeeE/YedE thiosulfate transporter family protein [Teredinibacter haidensis]